MTRAKVSSEDFFSDATFPIGVEKTLGRTSVLLPSNVDTNLIPSLWLRGGAENREVKFLKLLLFLLLTWSRLKGDNKSWFRLRDFQSVRLQ